MAIRAHDQKIRAGFSHIGLDHRAGGPAVPVHGRQRRLDAMESTSSEYNDYLAGK